MSRLFAAANKRPCPGYPGNAREVVPDMFPTAPFGSKWTIGGGGNEWHLIDSNGNGGSSRQHREHQHQRQQQQQHCLKLISILEHLVLPSDTFGGICLRYKISANRLRQFNRFSGSNLSLVPSKLYIPVPISTSQTQNKVKVVTATVRPQDTLTEEYKVTCMIHCFVPALSRKVAAAYLRICNWNIEDAVAEAQGDLDWEVHHESLMLDRILSLRDRKNHEAEEARSMEKQRSNFCLKAFETFLQDHGVKLTKTNNKEMWFEMKMSARERERPALQKMSRRPSAASLTSSSDDGNSSSVDVDDDLFAREYGENNKPSNGNSMNQYSVKYDVSSHRLQTRSASFQLYNHSHEQSNHHHHLGDEVRAAALMVEQKLLDVLAMFQNREQTNHQFSGRSRSKNGVAFHEEETVAFFEMSDMRATGGKAKVA
jgi:hypothetical protein